MNKINRQIKKELEMSNCKSTREYVRKMIELVDNCDGDSESKDLLFADVMRLQKMMERPGRCFRRAALFL